MEVAGDNSRRACCEPPDANSQHLGRAREGGKCLGLKRVRWHPGAPTVT